MFVYLLLCCCFCLWGFGVLFGYIFKYVLFLFWGFVVAAAAAVEMAGLIPVSLYYIHQ